MTTFNTYIDQHGFVRFESNDAIPFPDYLAANHPDVDIDKHDQQRQDENIAAIRKMQEADEKFRSENPELAAEMDAERAFELRANFGPGETVVNVLTGRTVRT